MKKSKTGYLVFLKRLTGTYFFKVMRVTVFLILIGISNIYASSTYSQATKFTFNLRNISLEQLFEEIESQSEFNIFYKNSQVDKNRMVDITASNVSVEDILTQALEGTDLDYKVIDRQIVIFPRKMLSEKVKTEEPVVEQPEQKTVYGKVTDSSGSPLPGVTVVVKGTTKGTISNSDGEYSLADVPLDATLQFSFVGMKSQEIPVAGKSNINITMEEESIGLEEVIAVGYGTMKKSDITGSVASVSSSDLMKSKSTASIDNMLQGKIAGVNVVSTSAEPGGNVKVRIRGSSSISGNNEPLYVIDGFPMINDNPVASEGQDQRVPTNVMINLNPKDIESIEVLKDASATAIYGSRGANGVILITTKSGKTGVSKINVDYTTGISYFNNTIPLVGTLGYAQYRNEFTTDGITPRYSSGGYTEYYGYTIGPTHSPEECVEVYGPGFDQQKALLRTGLTNELQVNFSGGLKNLRYNLGANYLNEKGVIISSGIKRYNLRLNVNSDVGEKLKVAANIFMTRTEVDKADNSTGRYTGSGEVFSGNIGKALRANPMVDPDINYITENYLDYPDLVQVWGVPYIYSVKQDALNTENNRFTNFVLTNLKLDFEILPGLILTAKGGANTNLNENETFYNDATMAGRYYGGYGIYSSLNRLDVLFENYLTFDKKIGQDHNFNAVIGYSLQNTEDKLGFIKAQDYITTSLGIHNFDLANQLGRYSKTYNKRTLRSFYGRFNYNFKDRYLLTFTARNDASSVFAENKKNAFFPSGAVAWRVSQEPFMKTVVFISNLKLRGSYGLTGNQAISVYGSLPSYETYGLIYDESIVALGVIPGSPGNDDLTWETTKQLDIGLDAGFWKGRFSISADYYNKIIKDLLQSMPVPLSSGFTTILTNSGEIRNRGIELDISAHLLDRQFSWMSKVTFSKNVSKILDLGTGERYFPGAVGAGLESMHILEEGGPLGNFYLYKEDGFLSQEDIDSGYPTYGTHTEPGQVKIWDNPADSTGVGIINSEDKYIAGNAMPDFEFGFTNDFSYKNFTLSVSIYGAIGQEVLNLNKWYYEFGTLQGVPSKEYWANRWTPETAETAKFAKPINGNQLNIPTDRLVEDGSYVRLNNVTLGYNIPTRKIRWLRNARVYLEGNNLLVLTKYSGYDPEVSATGLNNLKPGVDAGSYPRPKTFKIGFKFEL